MIIVRGLLAVATFDFPFVEMKYVVGGEANWPLGIDSIEGLENS
jgi:hypothetical protein